MRQSVTFKRKRTVYEFRPFVYAYIPGLSLKSEANLLTFRFQSIKLYKKRELSKYNLNIVVLEKGVEVCQGTTKANSAIVHGGFDAKEGSLKAKLNVRGNKLYKDSLFIKSISIKKEYINNHPKTRAAKRFRHNKERAFENNK